MGRFNGQPAVNMVVVKERQGDAIDIAARVRALVKEVRDRLPETITIGVFNDFSVIINNRLNTLRWSGLIGLIIVLIALWAFVRTRIAILTGFGIPFAMLGAIVFMSGYGITLNMVSLFSLILVLGLLVDDAVIVTENVYRYVEQGMDSRQAATKGATEVAWPVVATVLTTISAFIPLLMLPGTMGVFLAHIPIVVSFALLASLIEVLLILPSHLTDLISPAYAQKVRGRTSPWLLRARTSYSNLLAIALRWRYVSVALLICITALLSTTALYRIPFVLFRQFETSQFFINFETSPASKIEDTLAIAKQAEQVIKKLPQSELKSLATNVGVTFLDIHRAERGPNLGQFVVQLHEDRDRTADEVIDDVRSGIAQIPGITKVQFLKLQAGPGGPAIEARVVGEEIQLLRQLANEMKGFLQGIPGVHDVRDDFTEGKEELQITLKPEARALGLDLGQIARQVQQGFLGVEASTIQRRDEDVPIVIRYPQAMRETPETVARMKLTLPSGQRVFLRDVAPKAEQVIKKLPQGELKSLATNVGVTFLDIHRAERGPNLGQFVVQLHEDRERTADEVIDDVRSGIAQIPGITKVQFLKLQAGPGGPAIEARVVGEEIQLLRQLANEMKGFLQGIPGVHDVRDDFTEGKEELQITLKPEARALGLDLGQIARQVQQGFLGVEASTIQRRDEDVPIVIRYPQAMRETPETVARMKLTLPSGQRVFLRDVVHLNSAVG